MLSNPLYAGLIRLPAFEGKPERIIKALHEPIISEARFWITQEILKGRPRQKSRPREEFPLRGILRCTCGSHMTAGFSKGRSKYYMYYQCIKERGKVCKGEEVHEKIEELLYNLSFTREQIEQIVNNVKAEMSQTVTQNVELLSLKKTEFKELNGKIERLEEKMVNDQISPCTYKVWFYKLNARRSVVENDIILLNSGIESRLDNLTKAIPLLTDFRKLYNDVTLEGKQMLLRTWFEHGIAYDKGVFRTAKVHPALIYNYQKIKEKGLLFEEQPQVFFDAKKISTA